MQMDSLFDKKRSNLWYKKFHFSIMEEKRHFKTILEVLEESGTDLKMWCQKLILIDLRKLQKKKLQVILTL